MIITSRLGTDSPIRRTGIRVRRVRAARVSLSITIRTGLGQVRPAINLIID